MNILVISYSLTGNNEALAASIASKLPARHIKVQEPKKHAMGSIVMDLIFNRTPQVQPLPSEIGQCDLLLFVGPIWMGSIATPLRAYFRHLKNNSCKYAFISISGGADGPNLKLATELEKRTGSKPKALIDLHIADLLPADPKPTRDDTSSYKLTSEDVEKLTDTVMKTLGESIFQER